MPSRRLPITVSSKRNLLLQDIEDFQENLEVLFPIYEVIGLCCNVFQFFERHEKLFNADFADLDISRDFYRAESIKYDLKKSGNTV